MTRKETAMTFEEFKQRAFAICESVKPGCYVRAELASHPDCDDEWHVATDAWRRDDGDGPWYHYGPSPEDVLTAVRVAAADHTRTNNYTDEYRREVAEAMGLL
jgi:hypothetical protein